MEKSQDINPRPAITRLENWHVTPSNAQSFAFLDGIRGIAILLVVFCHLFYINPKATGIVKFVGSAVAAGSLGVTVFFALSGFLISLPFWKCKLQGKSVHFRSYFHRRFWKIYPPLAFSVVFLLPFYIWIYGETALYLKTAVDWLTGIAWLIPVSGKFNTVMWSLIVEVHFYLLLPLAFISLRKVSYRTSLWALFLGLLFVPLGAKWLYATQGMAFALAPMIQVAFPVRMDAFAAGVFIAGIYQRGGLHPRMAWLGPLGVVMLGGILVLCGAAEIVPSIKQYWTESPRYYATMLASACMLCFVAQPALAAKWGLCLGGLRWLGLISYEWYLFHGPSHVWLRHTLGSAEGHVAKYLVITAGPFCASLLVAASVYWLLSLPLLRKHRK